MQNFQTSQKQLLSSLVSRKPAKHDLPKDSETGDASASKRAKTNELQEGNGAKNVTSPGGSNSGQKDGRLGDSDEGSKGAGKLGFGANESGAALSVLAAYSDSDEDE